MRFCRVHVNNAKMQEMLGLGPRINFRQCAGWRCLNEASGIYCSLDIEKLPDCQPTAADRDIFFFISVLFTSFFEGK